MARPTKYEPSMCDTVVRVMSEGGSKLEAAVEIGINESTLYEWVKSNEEFSKAVKDGEDASKAWWERIGRKAALGEIQGFNATAWIFNMKNRAGWTDRQETTHKGGITVVASDLDEQL